MPSGRARLAAGALLAALTLPASAAGVPPERVRGPTIVSINLCTDQLLVSLADPGQIAGLSRFASDPKQSPIAARAAEFRILAGAAEEVLMLGPDLVLAGRYTRRTTRDLLKAQNVRVAELDAPRSIEDAKRQILQVGALVGRPDRGTRLVQAIDDAIGRARADLSAAAPSILSVQRRGWIAGSGTLFSSILETAGFRNEGSAFSPSFGRFVSLEEVVTSRADLLLVSGGGTAAEDQGSALLAHPALIARFPPEKRIVIPDRLLVCGGPEIIQAIDVLSERVRALRRAP